MAAKARWALVAPKAANEQLAVGAGRVTFSIWSGGPPGGVAVASVYVITGKGLDADNAAILHI